ncbi:HD domain-containing protein [Pseudodesulfovibrio sediminis]|uniref:HD family phosphohydrolase n=1 Tax=Pseudodesulfovibrio sediminis TaxID=2810563 RepID=A0ABN6EMU7_9BACT|nr:HD domain-containing protein [Pseudodesulfovibrio sediminis]BCS87421.1 HD family phosphohydrolase [Pseudodesulfovibrio sediminis]
MHLDRHIQTFTDFSTAYLSGNADKDYHIQLKIDHTMRVLDNAKAIIKGEGLNGRSARLSLLSALYHDIGRFPQFKQYDTFRDAHSVNHGRLGVLTLRTIPIPDSLDSADLRILKAAVGLHNVKEINPNCPAFLKNVVNVVRDSDKLDIYDVVLDHLSITTDPKRIVIHSLEEHPTKYSDTVFKAVFEGQTCDYSNLYYSNDFILLLVGWLFKLAFPTTISLLSERGCIDRIFALLPKDKRIQSLEQKAHTFIRYNI